jgi:hypothetical protein
MAKMVARNSHHMAITLRKMARRSMVSLPCRAHGLLFCTTVITTAAVLIGGQQDGEQVQVEAPGAGARLRWARTPHRWAAGK